MAIEKLKKGLDGIIRFNQRQLIDLEKLLGMQATDEEIAACFGIHRSTLADIKKRDPAFAESYKRGKDTGRASLRHLMWQSAVGTEGGRDPNVSMQIFLAKNILGMSDKQEITGKDKEPITFRVVTDA
jgi:hypothetical protein